MTARPSRHGILGLLGGLAPWRAPGADVLEPRSHGRGIFSGRSPSLREIEALARKHGLRSLLNLNTEGESGELLSPNVEASWAHAFAMVHERVSIDVKVLRSEWVDRFLATVQGIAKPVYVHSQHGRRAAALIGVQLALERGLSGQELLAQARGLGLDGAPQSLTDFLVAEVDRRARASPAGTARP